MNTPNETPKEEYARMRRHEITSTFETIIKIWLAITILLAMALFVGAVIDPAFTYQTAFGYWSFISASFIGFPLLFVIMVSILEFPINGNL